MTVSFGRVAGQPDQALPNLPSAAVPGSRRSLLTLPVVVVAVLMAPSVLWICRDNLVWPWDQAWYGQVSMALVRSAYNGWASWWQVMVFGMPSKPPLLTWVGQLAVPLSGWVGSPERAMLLVNVVANAGTLFMIFSISFRLSRSAAAATAAVLFCGGSSLFIGMTHQYFVEPLQTLALVLLMRISLDATRVGLLSLLFRLLSVISLAMIAKTTSTGFILPFLLYVVLARLSMKDAVAPWLHRRDAGLAVFSLAICVLSITWYMKNWAAMVQHFTNSTSSETALHYGSIGTLGVKLMFWLEALKVAVSPWPLGVTLAFVLILLSLGLASFRIVRWPWRGWLSRSVEAGTLFALCCAGTLASGIVAYATQINEETRFLLPMIPLIAVLLAFALGVFNYRALAIAACLAGTANAAYAHLFAHQLISLSPYHSTWLQPFHSEPESVERLTTAVQQTCDRSRPSRYRVIGVEFPDFNANSASFYAEKIQRRGLYDCYYTSLGYAETDVQRSIKRIYDLDTEYFITLPLQKIPVAAPGDFLNHTDIEVAKHVARSKDFQPVMTDPDQLLIFRRSR